MRDDQLERTLYEKFRQFAKGRAQSALRYRTRQRSARGRGKEKNFVASPVANRSLGTVKL